ncbi:MAG: protein kinase [Myxococcales bacterium]|jgi:serine/threonine protein kinase|nr:protein kinase [Myxococcales bacterium]
MDHRHQLITRLEDRALSELFMAQREGDASGKCLIKLFHQRFSTPEFGQALLAAARDAASIGSPHLLTYEAVGVCEGRLAASRPYVEGYALDDVIRRLYSKEVVLTAQLALYLVAEIASVVAQAHGKGIVHGAIDPSNLLIGFDGVIRVTGLGMMRAVGASEALKALAPKLHKPFRAPEQRDPCQATQASDVYALGTVAYELLTLTSVSDVREGGLSTKRDTLLPPSRLNRRINARIDPIVMRALDPMPTRRFSGAAQFAEALRSLFAILGAAVGPLDLARFCREVFPNEVSISGGISSSEALPIHGFFAIAPLAGEAAGRRAVAPESSAVVSAQPAMPPAPTEAASSVVEAADDGIAVVEEQLFDEAFGSVEMVSGLDPRRRQTADAPASVLAMPASSLPPSLPLPPAPSESPSPSPSSDQLASWDAPAGPMPSKPLRANVSDLPAPPTAGAAPSEAAERAVDASNEIAAPSLRDGGGGAAQTEEAPLAVPQEEGLWNAFAPSSQHQFTASRRGKKSEASSGSQASPATASRPTLREPKSQTEPDWHIPPQPMIVPKRQQRHWAAWAISLVAALGMAVLVLHLLFEREPEAARLSKETLQKFSGVLDGARPVAYLSVQTNVSAEVILDGKKIPERAPFDRMALPPGRHIVRLVRGTEIREFGLLLTDGQHEQRVENFSAPETNAAPNRPSDAPRAPPPRSPPSSPTAPNPKKPSPTR